MSCCREAERKTSRLRVGSNRLRPSASASATRAATSAGRAARTGRPSPWSWPAAKGPLPPSSSGSRRGAPSPSAERLHRATPSQDGTISASRSTVPPTNSAILRLSSSAEEAFSTRSSPCRCSSIAVMSWKPRRAATTEVNSFCAVSSVFDL